MTNPVFDFSTADPGMSDVPVSDSSMSDAEDDV